MTTNKITADHYCPLFQCPSLWFSGIWTSLNIWASLHSVAGKEAPLLLHGATLSEGAREGLTGHRG